MDDTAHAGEHAPAQPKEPADGSARAPLPQPAEALPSQPAPSPPDARFAAVDLGDAGEATAEATDCITAPEQPTAASHVDTPDPGEAVTAAPALVGIGQAEADGATAERADAEEPEACSLAERIEAQEHFQEYLQGRLRDPSDTDPAVGAGQVDADAEQRAQEVIAGARAPAPQSASLAAEPEVANLAADAATAAPDNVVVASVLDAEAATLRAAPDVGAPPHPIDDGAGQVPAVLEPAVQEVGEVRADGEAQAAVDEAASEPGPASDQGSRASDSATLAPIGAMEAPGQALRSDSELSRGDPLLRVPATAASTWVPALVAPPPVLERPEAELRRAPPYADTARAALQYLRRALWGTGVAAAGLTMSVLVLVVAYRWINPPLSTLMLGQSLAGTPIERTWVPITRISPNLIRAVVLSEDGGFCRHHGVDWVALQEAIESDRGGSTITMQVVKNLFLWPSRSYVRKAIEIGLAYLVEAVWPKRRILEIYLNIAEWGDGVFGAEAAAHTHFDKRASQLTPEEAALLAVALPNPIERTPAAPSFGTGRLASRLMVRMATARADFSCVLVERAAPKKAPLVPGLRLTL